MSIHSYLRRLTAGALAAVAGVAVAFAVSGGLPTTGTATAASQVVHARHHHRRHGRTATPKLNDASYLVRAGSRFRVLVKPHGQWKHPRTCTITVSRGRHARTYRVKGVVSNFLVTLPTSRKAQEGSWQLAVSCAAKHAASSRRATATVLVASSRRSHGPLLGRRARLNVQPLQAHPKLVSGKYGLGGAPPNPGFPNGQCTYYAYEMRSDIYWTSVDNGAPKYGWDADKWSGYAAQYGHYAEGPTPEVGAIMVQPASSHSSVGHVAYVTQVTDPQHWVTQEMNTDGAGTPNKVFTVYDNSIQSGGIYDYRVGGLQYRHVLPGTVFIYTNTTNQAPAAPAPAPTPTPTPTPGPTTTVVQTTTVGGTTTVTNTVTQPTSGGGGTPAPPPPPPTWNETAGGVAHTWTDYSNAGGNEGPSIGGGQTVQIACRLQGFKVADGNTWWYRIASAPWSNSYYVSADAFYNDGATSGSLSGTPFVDPNVAGC